MDFFKTLVSNWSSRTVLTIIVFQLSKSVTYDFVACFSCLLLGRGFFIVAK